MEEQTGTVILHVRDFLFRTVSCLFLRIIIILFSSFGWVSWFTASHRTGSAVPADQQAPDPMLLA